MRIVHLTVIALVLCLLAPWTRAAADVRATGDLSVTKASSAAAAIVSVGDTISYIIVYDWTGDGPAPGVTVSDVMPSSVTFVSAIPAPASHVGSTYVWAAGNLQDGAIGTIFVTAVVNSGLSPGTVISNTASITGSVADLDPSNDQSVCDLTVQLPAPDLAVFQTGLLESLQAGLLLTGEQGAPFEIQIYYFNYSRTGGTATVVTDTLPNGMTFVEANPAPSSVAGQILSWNLGNVPGNGFGTIAMTIRPDQSGSFENRVHISSAETDRDPSSNTSTFPYNIVTILPPILLKPAIMSGTSDTVVTTKNPRLEGLAKAGATVTVYDGSPLGCFGDLSSCGPVILGSTVAGPDRRWSLPMASMTEARLYYLYFQAELAGQKSAPPYGYWLPIVLNVDSTLEAAGVDLENFVVGSSGQERRPGFAGGSSGATPNQEITITIRQSACDQIETTPGLWVNHALLLVIDEGSGPVNEFLPVSQVARATPTVPGTLGKFDFVYRRPGLGPGSKMQIWYKPVAYDSTCAALVALTYVKFHEVLIDPAGYVYDVDVAGTKYDWPDVPPSNSLLTTATVSALTRTGDDQWELWQAAPTGQVNPQVTDTVTPDKITVAGYYAFYVPSGQYRVEATAPGYVDHTSPILTVIDAPVFYNAGMNRAPGSVTTVGDRPGPLRPDAALPDGILLQQNYPNPFNPSTTIAYVLSRPGLVTLRVYDALGRTVSTLAEEEKRLAGQHVAVFDASGLASGVYFYRLTVRPLAGGKPSSMTKRLTLVR